MSSTPKCFRAGAEAAGRICSMTRKVVRVPRLECLTVAPIGNETEQLLIAPPHDRLNSFSDHSVWVVDDGRARITGSD
jgi:hypothetical protein